jgi:serine/threonine protein kinase
MIDERLGSQYVVQRELGRGGMGVVYLARERTRAMDLHGHVTTNAVLCVLTEGRLDSDHACSVGPIEP